jgi:hypothetical protein
MFGKYNGFVSKARVSACMYFLVWEFFVPARQDEVFIWEFFISLRQDPGICCRDPV